MKFQILFLSAIALASASFVANNAVAGPAVAKYARWTAADDKIADFEHIVAVASARTGYALKVSDFVNVEDRDLAFNHFRMYAQTAADVPVKGASIRVWTVMKDVVSIQPPLRPIEETVQVEAFVQNPTALQAAARQARVLGLDAGDLHSEIDSNETMALVRAAIAKTDDSAIHGIRWTDQWDMSQGRGELVRVVKVRSRRGRHEVTISFARHAVAHSEYESFPQRDGGRADVEAEPATETEIPVQIYPVYEETEAGNILLPRTPGLLKYIKAVTARVTADPYAGLRTRHYYEDQFDPLLGETDAGRARGFWSMNWIKRQAGRIRSELPQSPNTFANGLSLDGRYATVSFHPSASRYHPTTFTPGVSPQFYPNWMPVMRDGKEVEEMIPMASVLGKPIMSPAEAASRPARRLPEHDPVAYIDDGFDELQVYYAVNQLFDSLRGLGFTDPELSTRPFNAFLYDPDISMRDNAYYTDDTINFTTYSRTQGNMARDNPTIWHELGHGVMDRLMGDEIKLADTGGLSEGMADFVAAMVLSETMGQTPFPGSDGFRIINKIGFLLTNEVHDDGESYGGSMRDMMEAAISQWGRAGLHKMVDLTLETMRLTRNHPGLTADGWFDHMLFADQLGRPGVRAAGELRSLVLGSLALRNYPVPGTQVGTFSLKNGVQELTKGSNGTRDHGVKVQLAENQTSTFNLTASVKDGDAYHYRFPVQVRVYFRKGALQGAIHWNGEENEVANGPVVYTLDSQADVARIPLTVQGKCDEVNRDDGSCVDYAYVQIWNSGETAKPQAKKRFYVQVMPATKTILPVPTPQPVLGASVAAK